MGPNGQRERERGVTGSVREDRRRGASDAVRGSWAWLGHARRRRRGERGEYCAGLDLGWDAGRGKRPAAHWAAEERESTPKTRESEREK